MLPNLESLEIKGGLVVKCAYGSHRLRWRGLARETAEEELLRDSYCEASGSLSFRLKHYSMHLLSEAFFIKKPFHWNAIAGNLEPQGPKSDVPP